MHRDMFLIGVYSGQRFSDYSVFEKADVRKGMIIKRAEKTETNSYIPLHPKLETAPGEIQLGDQNNIITEIQQGNSTDLQKSRV